MWVGMKTPLHHVEWEHLSATWALADAAEAIVSGWVFDHVVPVWGDAQGSCLESWSSLAALAVQTRRLAIGCLCSPVAMRHPVLLAQMSATVQQISGGRLSVGLGTGSKDWELRGLGIWDEEPAVRCERLAEALILIRHAWQTKTHLLHTGDFYHCDLPSGMASTLGEIPPPRLVVGGRSNRILALASEHADQWNFSRGTPGEFARAKARLLAYADSARRVEPLICSAHLVWEGFDPCQLAEDLTAWRDVGADGVVVALPSPWPLDAVKMLARVASEL